MPQRIASMINIQSWKVVVVALLVSLVALVLPTGAVQGATNVVSPLTAASGGGCSSYVLYSKVGLNVKSCISQGASLKVYPDEYMTYRSDSKTVYSANVEVEGWRYSNTSSTTGVERRSRKVIDITYYVNKRPRPSYDHEDGSWFSATNGQILRSRTRLCVKMTASSSTECSAWVLSPVLIAGD